MVASEVYIMDAFSRTALLLGGEAMDKLKAANAEKAFAAIYFKEMIALHICDNMQNIFLHTNKLCPEKQNLFRRVYLSYKAFPYFILNYLLTSHLYLFLVYTFCYISSSVFLLVCENFGLLYQKGDMQNISPFWFYLVVG
jgi:hypothetical protein